MEKIDKGIKESCRIKEILFCTRRIEQLAVCSGKFSVVEDVLDDAYKKVS